MRDLGVVESIRPFIEFYRKQTQCWRSKCVALRPKWIALATKSEDIHMPVIACSRPHYWHIILVRRR